VMRPVDGEAGGTPESEAEAQIRHGREAAAAAEASDADIVDGDVVQEIDATPPVIDVAATAAQADGPQPESASDEESSGEAPSRGRRKRATKTAAPSRARKTASRPRSSARRKAAPTE